MMGGFLGALALLLVISACGADVPDSERMSYEIVSEEEIVIWSVDEDLADVRDMSVVGDNVFVLANMGAPVHHYDVNGRKISEIAQRGEGPSDIRNPWGLVTVESASALRLAVWDIGARQIKGFAVQSGEFQGRIDVDVPGGMVRGDVREFVSDPPRRLAPFGRGFVLLDHPRGLTIPPDLLTARLLRLDSTGTESGELWRAEPSGFPEDIQRAFFMTPGPVWASCSSRELVLHDPSTMTVEWYGSDDTTTGGISVADWRRPIEEGDVYSVLGDWLRREIRDTDGRVDEVALEELLDEYVQEAAAQFPENSPMVSSIVCDRNGRTLVERFDASEEPLGRSGDWYAMSKEEGVYKKIELPSRFRPMTIGDGHLWGIVHDEYGVERIGHWEISW